MATSLMWNFCTKSKRIWVMFVLQATKPLVGRMRKWFSVLLMDGLPNQAVGKNKVCVQEAFPNTDDKSVWCILSSTDRHFHLVELCLQIWELYGFAQMPSIFLICVFSTPTTHSDNPYFGLIKKNWNGIKWEAP
jgi:hypothetical protein